MDPDLNLSQPKRWSSQLLFLAATATQPSDALASRVRPSSESLQRPSITPRSIVQDQELVDMASHLPSPRPAGLRRTGSFCPLPSSLPWAHTIMMSHVDSDITGGASLGGDPYHVGSPTIDEVSPDKDEHFAESVIHNKCMSLSFSTRTYSVSAPNTDIPASTTMGEYDMNIMFIY
jgi:hypothetical protein